MANLTQLRMLESLDGFLLVDKPVGIPFSSVVKAVKRRFNLVKVGHGGSLDASASGLLVLLIGDANKFVGDVMGADRSWTGTLRLGRVTNTHDLQGATVSEWSGEDLATYATGDRLAAALRETKGDVFQTEPRFCAVRKEGTGEYTVADTGEHTPCLAHVYRFAVGAASAEDPALRTFELRATKGLLVRTLVHDFGAALGCGAALAGCRRTALGKFRVEDAVPFDRVLAAEPAEFAALTIPIGKAIA